MANSSPVVVASDQSAVPVSGTVTANIGTVATLATAANQTTLIGHVDGVETLLGTIDTDTGAIATSTASIDSKIPALGQALAAASVPVILPAATITTLTPPAAITGYGTAANQTTIIGHLDGVEGLLTTIDTDTGDIAVDADAIRVAVQLLDDSVQVLGTDTYTEASSKGITLGAVRRDADTTLVNTTNEFTPLQVDANGRLKVEAFSGETLPVSGTVTANLAAGTNNIGDVDVLSVPAPLSTAGGGTEATALRVTIASDSSGVVSIDDNGGSLTVDGTVAVTGVSTLAEQQTQTTHLATIAGDTTDIETAVELLDDTVATTGAAITTKGLAAAGTDGTNARILKTDSSGELQVDVLTMPTVTVNSHAVTNAGTFAVQVDGAALTALQLIDDTVFAEDSAHTTADKGIQSLAVRRDTASALGADNDYTPLTTNARAATWVAIEDGAGGQITSFGGGTQYTEDAAAAANPVGTVPILVRKDTPSSEVTTDGDNVAQRGTTYGAAYVTLLDTAGSPVSVGGGTQYTEDAAAAANPIGNALIGVRADSLAGVTSTDGDNVAARMTDKGELYVKHVDPIIITDDGGSITVDGVVSVDSTVPEDEVWNPLGAAPFGMGAYASTATKSAVSADGDMVALWADRNGRLRVTGDASMTALKVEDTTAQASLSVMDDWDNAASDGASVSGDVAHDSADAGEPVKIGFKAETSPKGITLVADGDRTDAHADSDGILMVKIGTSGADRISERVSNTDGNSTAFTNFSAVASTYNNITDVTIHNAHATTNCYVDLRDGTAGSVLWTFPAPATGGVTHHFNPPLKQTTANTALAYDVSAAVSTVYISVNGFQSKV